MQIIDISGWAKDEQFSPYPEGSRDKYAVFSPETPEFEFILPAHRYLMKFSNPRYDMQFWSEVIAGIVAKHAGVRAPKCYLSIDPETDEMGSLTSWFYGKGAEDDFGELTPAFASSDVDDTVPDLHPDDAPESYSRYIPGSAYMVRFIKNFDLKKGRQHNLVTLSRLITALRMRHKVDTWPHWISVFVFDALIGNTDRHQDNWGLLWRKNNDGVTIPRFSPAFDNGTSLLHEIVEEKIPNFLDADHRARYIARGRHHIRLTIDAPKQAKHLELLTTLVDQREALRHFVDSLTAFDVSAMNVEIEALSQIVCPTPISNDRCRAINAILNDRISLIRNACLND